MGQGQSTTTATTESVGGQTNMQPSKNKTASNTGFYQGGRRRKTHRATHKKSRRTRRSH